MKKKNAQCRNGFAYAYVIGVFLVVSLFASLILFELNQAITENHIRSMSMKSYYLCYQAADATVAALTMDDNDVINDMINHSNYHRTDKIFHTDETNNNIGESSITLEKEPHKYYGKNKEWIVAYIETRIPDERAYRKGEDFIFKGSVMILLDNPEVRIYNINPDNLS